MVFRFTSPNLSNEEKLLRECPVGMILRETPQIYDAIYAHSVSAGSGLEILNSPQWLQSALNVIAVERDRLKEMADRDAQAARDAQIGKRAIRRMGG